ncbi:MAG: lysophospholipid acyltransferase family protein [Ignavibacteriaceae bacterium]|nr:lysophospholipid acyltransferase family protein [Ignavibacteriaceae bacterium]
MKGKENIPAEGPAILASNHISLLDAPLIAVTINRRLSAYAKESVFNNKIKRWYLKCVGGIIVQTEKMNRELITGTKRIFESGRLLIIFPEGRIYHNGDPSEFNNGFMRIAFQFNVPVIPVKIKGTEKLLGNGQRFPKPGKLEIVFGEPVKLDLNNRRLTKDEIQQAAEKIKHIIQKI